jgi:hypothetical protein
MSADAIRTFNVYQPYANFPGLIEPSDDGGGCVPMRAQLVEAATQGYAIRERCCRRMTVVDTAAWEDAGPAVTSESARPTLHRGPRRARTRNIDRQLRDDGAASPRWASSRSARPGGFVRDRSAGRCRRPARPRTTGTGCANYALTYSGLFLMGERDPARRRGGYGSIPRRRRGRVEEAEAAQSRL